MSNQSETLYIGVTNNLERRVLEQKSKQINGFTQKYNLTKLVYYEAGASIQSAIEREKTLKGWKRERKIKLISGTNPRWNDLSNQWLQD